MTGSELIFCFRKPSKTQTLISSLKLLGRWLLHSMIKHSVLWRFDFKISSPHYNFGAKLSDLPDKSLVHPVWHKIVSSVWSNHLPAFSPTLSPIGSYTCVSFMCPFNFQVCVHTECVTALPYPPWDRLAWPLSLRQQLLTSRGPFVSLDVGSSTWVSSP